MHRYRFVLHRPLQLLPVVFGISTVSYTHLTLPTNSRV